MLYKFKVTDLEVSRVDNHFITEFSFYLRVKGGCANNSAVKHLKNLGKVMRICVANKWIQLDPFAGLKNKVTKVERAILTERELETLADKVFPIARLQVVKDVFVFCCYTGLSFIDVQQLTSTEISISSDGMAWIKKLRHKTLVASHIPLLPVALEIIERYKYHPVCKNSGMVLPVVSNQK
ncbi:phage integrase SAM-like domain-containing protein [Pedobacter sp. JCM 36344]|uniref:phage integrase SAM-like domain-containing protein n=1 Tax=Pedobacter sp. JCM 36344 TaxID=3374280 RepID=UPI0039791BF4